ncbi:MAG: Gfo/Idh/MocA family oxidoreductase, partial [Bryobacteraceae bacterium]|nr:Gfo/Idh/MocA family oxidoreductase [Bryobacteraceae bacterium]
MNRRYFIGAAMAAAPASRVRLMAAAGQVNVAIIGVGGRGRSMINDFRQIPGARISHLCDADQASLEKAMAIVEKHGMPRPQTVTDMRRIFDDKTVDAVSIATPDHWHAPAAILACDAGKDVYVEKPPSHNIREGRLIIDAARRNNRIV